MSQIYKDQYVRLTNEEQQVLETATTLFKTDIEKINISGQGIFNALGRTWKTPCKNIFPMGSAVINGKKLVVYRMKDDEGDWGIDPDFGPNNDIVDQHAPGAGYPELTD